MSDSRHNWNKASPSPMHKNSAFRTGGSDKPKLRPRPDRTKPILRPSALALIHTASSMRPACSGLLRRRTFSRALFAQRTDIESIRKEVEADREAMRRGHKHFFANSDAIKKYAASLQGEMDRRRLSYSPIIWL